MGLYEIVCPVCKKGHTWFSGDKDQRCIECKRESMMSFDEKIRHLKSGDYYTFIWDGEYKRIDDYKFDECGSDLFVKSSHEETIFHVGRSYEGKPCRTLICKRCGSDKFFVGVGDYFTAIKCSHCKWEKCVHEG